MNIKYKGKHKGRICTNAKALGKTFTIDQLALRIGEMIQYKNYHAAHTYPFPEDEEVAKWVREFAEPQDIVNYMKGIGTDESLLMNPLPSNPVSPEPNPAEDPIKAKGGIKIKGRKTPDNKHIKIKKKDPPHNS